MASLFKRGAVYWAGYRLNGKKRNVSLDTHDERKARRQLAILEAQLESGELEERARRLTFDAFLALYAEAYKAAGGAECALSREKSWRSDSPALQNFVRYAASQGVTKIDRVDSRLAEGFLRFRLEEFVPSKKKAKPAPKAEGAVPQPPEEKKPAEDEKPEPKKRISTATANHDLRVVKAAFGWAVRAGHLKANPFANTRQMKLPAREIRFLREEQAAKVVEAVRGKSIERPVLLMLYAGLRLNEALHLRWCDVDFASNLLRIVNHDDFVTKSRQARSIPIAAELRTLLLSWRASEGLVAASETGGELDEANLRHRLARIAKRLKLRLSPHTLRRTFASLLRMKGVPLDRISLYLGHSSVAVTERWYAGMDVTGDDSDVSKLSFAGKAGLSVIQGGAQGREDGKRREQVA